jgi:hypothetical protein
MLYCEPVGIAVYQIAPLVESILVIVIVALFTPRIVVTVVGRWMPSLSDVDKAKLPSKIIVLYANRPFAAPVDKNSGPVASASSVDV